MNRIFAMMRYSKKYMWRCIAVFAEIMFVAFALIFDVVQLLLTKNNNAYLSSAFVGVNIALIILLAINLILIVCFVIINKRKEKNNELKKD